MTFPWNHFLRKSIPAENDDKESAKYALVIAELKHERPPIQIQLRPTDSFVQKFYAYQTQIALSMRHVLFDWLLEVAHRFRQQKSTILLCFILVDMVLQIAMIERKELQRLGCACFSIAAKLNEIFVPDMRDYAYMTDSAYTPEEIETAEKDVTEGLLKQDITRTLIRTYLVLFRLICRHPRWLYNFTRAYFEFPQHMNRPIALIVATGIMTRKKRTMNAHPKNISATRFFLNPFAWKS